MDKKKTKAKPATKKKGKVDNRSRTTRIKQAMKESVRDKLKAGEYLKQLESAAVEYQEVITSISGLKQKRLTARSAKILIQVESQVKVMELQLKALKGLVDLNLRRLRFVLPELKAIELSDPSGNNPFAAFAEAVAAANEDYD